MRELATKINFDVGAAAGLDFSEYSNVLVITGTQHSLRVFEEKIRPMFFGKKTNFHIWTNISVNLPDYEVYSVMNFASGNNIDCILTVGADAVMDCGRLCNLLLSHGGFLHDYLPGGSMGTFGITPQVLPHITVPTMPSAGSEISGSAHFRQGNVVKTITSPFLVPSATYIDPLMMTGLPGELWAVRGFSAYATATAALSSAGANETSNSYAKAALDGYLNHVINLPKDPSNLELIKHACAVSINSLLAANYSDITSDYAKVMDLVSIHGVRIGVAWAMVMADNKDAQRVIKKLGLKLPKGGTN